MINTAASAADTEIREFCETLFEGIRVDHAVRQAKSWAAWCEARMKA